MITMSDSGIEAQKDNLREKIRRASTVIEELQTSQGFKILLEDHMATKKMLDDNWQLQTDLEKLKEMRITKLAIMSVVNTLQAYMYDKAQAEKELYVLDNPDSTTHRDYDAN